jgi:redox-sensing transcriptional repressor
MVGISSASRERLLHILRILETAVTEPGQPGPDSDRSPVSSARLETLTGWPRDTIRKDISCLAAGAEETETLGSSAGYTPERLIPRIKEALGLNRRRKCCVVGLGRLGSAYLNAGTGPGLLDYGEFELAAGFDTNVNRVEILKSPAPLFPAYKMPEVISRLGIEIALLCVPAEAAQGAAEKLAAAGIRGIVNFAPCVLKLQASPGGNTNPGAKTVTVRNVYLADELRALAVKMETLTI